MFNVFKINGYKIHQVFGSVIGNWDPDNKLWMNECIFGGINIIFLKQENVAHYESLQHIIAFLKPFFN